MATIPSVESKTAKTAAQMAMDAAFAREDAKVEVKKAAEEELVWVYGCDRNAKHFGIFFAGDPRGKTVFGPGDWYSTYHDNTEAADYEMDDLVCQQCFGNSGERVHLRLAPAQRPNRRAGVHFHIPESWRARFMHSVSKATLEDWLKLKKAPAVVPPPAPPAPPEPIKEKTDARSGK